MNTTKDLIREFITSLDTEHSKTITDETNLIDTGLLDSISMMSIIEFLETTIKVEVQDDDFDINNFNSINAITDIVNKYLSKKV